MRGDTFNLMIAAVTIVIGIAASYYFYRIGKKEPRPVYVVTGNVVVRGDEERYIEVRYKGGEVPMVARTVVVFWNAGREAIRGSDLVEKHPLTVSLPAGAVVLEARVLAATRKEIDFTCTIDEDWFSGVRLQFSHLNHQDGAAVEILHTGDHPMEPQVSGAIVGVDGPPSRIKTPLWDDPAGYKLPFALSAIFLNSLLIFLVMAGRNAWGNYWGIVLLCVLVSGVMAGIGIVARRQDKRRLPKALQDFVSPIT